MVMFYDALPTNPQNIIRFDILQKRLIRITTHASRLLHKHYITQITFKIIQ